MYVDLRKINQLDGKILICRGVLDGLVMDWANQSLFMGLCQ